MILRRGAPHRLAVLGAEPVFRHPIYVTRAVAPERELFQRYFDRVCDSCIFTNDGPYTRALESALQGHLRVGFCMAFANGTLALQIALRGLALSGEVITTPFTFPATVHAIRWNGLTPVFCDVDPETYNLDPARVADLVSEHTSAVLPVHVFGAPCDVSAFDKLASQRGLRVLYDAAHAFGVEALGKPIGHFGDLTVLSLHATKLFHTGEGGAILAKDARLRETLASLRNFGIRDEECVDGVGTNGKLSEVHAVLGLSILARIADETAARGERVKRYRSGLGDLPGLRFQHWPRGCKPNFSYMTIEIDPDDFGLTRDQVHIALRAENVITRKYFYPLCSENPSYRGLPSASREALPHAHRLAEHILCLPLYGEMPGETVDKVVALLGALHRFSPRIRRTLVNHGGRP